MSPTLESNMNKIKTETGETIIIKSGWLGCATGAGWKFEIKNEAGAVIGRSIEWVTSREKAIKEAEEYLKTYRGGM